MKALMCSRSKTDVRRAAGYMYLDNANLPLDLEDSIFILVSAC